MGVKMQMEIKKLFNIEEIEKAIQENAEKIESFITTRDELQAKIDELNYIQKTLYELKANADYLLLKSKARGKNDNT
jgi:DNA topoisomerase VI subunit B